MSGATQRHTDARSPSLWPAGASGPQPRPWPPPAAPRSPPDAVSGLLLHRSNAIAHDVPAMQQASGTLTLLVPQGQHQLYLYLPKVLLMGSFRYGSRFSSRLPSIKLATDDLLGRMAWINLLNCATSCMPRQQKQGPCKCEHVHCMSAWQRGTTNRPQARTFRAVRGVLRLG